VQSKTLCHKPFSALRKGKGGEGESPVYTQKEAGFWTLAAAGKTTTEGKIQPRTHISRRGLYINKTSVGDGHYGPMWGGVTKSQIAIIARLNKT